MARSTRTARRGALAAALGLAIAGVAAPAAGAPDTVKVPLNTGQEAASQGIPVNTGAHGWFTYSIEDDDLCYTLEVSNLSSGVLFAHIHVGPPGVIGPVVQPLTVVEGATSFTVTDCVTPSATLLAAIEENPRDFYVNVHSALFPVGEVRGTITH